MARCILHCLSVVLLIAFTSCKDIIGPKLSPATTSGANTFECKVDGKVWKPKGGWNVNAVSANFEPHKLDMLHKGFGNFVVFTSNVDGDNTGIQLQINEITGTGLYPITDISKGEITYYAGNGWYGSYSGSVTLTRLDTVNKIISGTFSFTTDTTYLNNPNTATYHITEGRFDFQYPTIMRSYH
jgi:hypothetical protein